MAERLDERLRATWRAQIDSGFVLGDPSSVVETRRSYDPVTGVDFRFRWMPHRELRAVPAELERLGILDADRDESLLYRDPRDTSGRHCFLCPANVAICHPSETLVPVDAGGRAWVAGANFAWLASDHFTVMAETHIEQRYSRSVLDAMLDIHQQTAGRFRVVFNGPGAGATIPWHLHFHISSDPMPVEALRSEVAQSYPTPVRMFPTNDPEAVHAWVTTWEDRDPAHHRVNLLVASAEQADTVFVFLRDARRTTASNKGLMGGWEVAGDFAYSEPGSRSDFEQADLATVRLALQQIRPISPEL